MTKRPKKPRPEGPRPDPAPGDLRLVQALLNTLDRETEHDEIGSPADLAAWLSSHFLLPDDSHISPTEWQNTLFIREGLRALLLARNSQSLDKTAVERLNRAVADATTRVHFGNDGTLGIRSLDPGWSTAVARLLQVAFEAVADGRWERFKACANPTCQWAFYDASSNRSAKWCTTRRCGNRINKRRHRRRKKV